VRVDVYSLFVHRCRCCCSALNQHDYYYKQTKQKKPEFLYIDIYIHIYLAYFIMTEKKIVLITGVNKGIDFEIARQSITRHSDWKI